MIESLLELIFILLASSFIGAAAAHLMLSREEKGGKKHDS